MTAYLADIHMPNRKTPQPEGVHIDAILNNWGRATLAMAMVQEGLEPTFSRGSSAYNLEDGSVDVLRTEGIAQREGGYDITVVSERVGLDSIRAIRNIAGVIGGEVPELNHPSVRELARDKAATNTLISSAGIQKDFITWQPSEDLGDKLEEIQSDNVVLKPLTGKQGKGVHMGTKSELVDLHKSGVFTEGQFIIEPRLSMDVPMPVRGATGGDQDHITWANEQNIAKELRAFYFGDDEHGEPQLHYVLRVAKPDMDHLANDDWVFVDQDSVPEELHGLSADLARQAGKVTDVKEVHLGIDWVRVQSANGEEYWVPMEINAGEPQLVYESNDKTIARLQATMLARQLKRVAQAGTTIYNGGAHGS